MLPAGGMSTAHINIYFEWINVYQRLKRSISRFING